MAALKIMDNGYVPKNRRLKGSWAGAMGQTQFMPASFLLYAIDGSGNGQIDIWHNKADVLLQLPIILNMKAGKPIYLGVPRLSYQQVSILVWQG